MGVRGEVGWVRPLPYVDGSQLRLDRRNLREVTARYTELQHVPDSLHDRQVVQDGEIVVRRRGAELHAISHRMHVVQPRSGPAGGVPVVTPFYIRTSPSRHLTFPPVDGEE